MNKQINRFKTSKEEIDSMNNIVNHFADLKTTITAENQNLDTVLNTLDALNINPDFKETIATAFKILFMQNNEKMAYKHLAFHLQDKQAECMEYIGKLKNIIKNQADKHNDKSGLEEMNESMTQITLVNSTGLSKYQQRGFKDFNMDNINKNFIEKLDECTIIDGETLQQNKIDKRKGTRLLAETKILVNKSAKSDMSKVVIPKIN